MPWRRCWCGRATRRRPVPWLESRKTQPATLESSRTQMRLRRPDTGATEPKPSAAPDRVEIKHQTLTHGDRCPECEKGNVYAQKEPKVLVRIIGQAPLAATVYALERLRCGACGQVFTAQEPEGVGAEKYDETTAAMIALLKYGSGMPFYRLEQLEQQLGIPLPASTQWEIVEEAAELIKPARDELIRQAAQGEVLHNDDTSMRVLRLAREPSDERTGVFTSGIVSTREGRKIALYFTGRQHAGENLADVLKHRSRRTAAPIQMCDALSRNAPKLADGTEILLANCLAHGRRQFVEVAANFPDECRYVLEMLGEVYEYDAEARDRGLSPAERLQFHQQHSGPVMEQLHQWLEAQLARTQDGAQLRSGQSDHLFVAPLESADGVPARSRRPAGQQPVRTRAEARRSASQECLVLSHAARRRGRRSVHEPDPHLRVVRRQSFDYLIELQRHARELAARPAEWMPWNYRDTLARTAEL